jgi:hypothetical protein
VRGTGRGDGVGNLRLDGVLWGVGMTGFTN